MFEKREIIYKSKTTDARLRKYKTKNFLNLFLLYAVISVYIINYQSYGLIKCLNHFNFINMVNELNVVIQPLTKGEIKMNPIYLIKKPLPFHYLPENNTRYYSISSNLTVTENLFFEGFREDYNKYITGNCWGERLICETVSYLTHELWDGCHWLTEKYGDIKVRKEEGLITERIKEMIKEIAVIIDTEQLNLFPEIQAKQTIRRTIIDYADTIYKSRVS